LIAGVAGCGDGVSEGESHTLIISSTTGGSVTTPGEGTFTYDAGTVVNLVAEAEQGYYFINWAGDVSTIGNVNAATTIITTNDDYGITANFGPAMVAANWQHTVGLKTDGTVVAVGNNDDRQLDVGDWGRIIQVAAGHRHTVGVKRDGRVVAVGLNDDMQCEVDKWEDITQVSAGGSHTVGLKDDGTVIAIGLNDDNRCDVGSWTDITQVAAGGLHTVGLKTDGTVVAVGFNQQGQTGAVRCR
jgi:alpha-tubulin suppressor-like RCC1 family protein